MSSAAAAAPLDKRTRRNSSKPSPLDAAIVAASNAVEGCLKSPMTPSRRAIKKEEGPPRSAPPISSPIEALAAAAVSAAAAATPKSPTAAEVKTQPQPSTSRQIPPNLNLSNPATPTTPNPALRSPRPPIKSAHFDALEAEGERDAMVRTLVLQLQREMQDEIDRLTSVHRKALEDKNAEFQALAELLSKKREDWSLQMAAKMTLIADQQHDIVGFVKQANESAIRIKTLEEELAKEKAANEKLRVQLGEVPSSKTFVKPKDPPAEEELILISSNKDSDGFEKPSTNARKAPKRPAADN